MNQLTAADLIAILQKVDPALPVVMAMNEEYSADLDADMVYVKDGVLYIDDTDALIRCFNTTA